MSLIPYEYTSINVGHTPQAPQTRALILPNELPVGDPSDVAYL